MKKHQPKAVTDGKPRQRLQKSPPGKVGIFWVHRGQLLAAPFSLEAGEDYGGAINGPTDHVKFWPEFQAFHHELRDLEYQDVPRGRVLFMKPDRQFRVYLDKTLHTARIKSAIRKTFGLAASSTRFLLDAHYTTDPADLKRLFED